MNIYDILPKVNVGMIEIVGFIDAPIEFGAESDEFKELIEGFEVPLTQESYDALLAKSPDGWKQGFQWLRSRGVL